MTRHLKRTRRPFASVQSWMDATGTTQEELAKALGISQSHLCNILRRNRKASAKLALLISRTTNVPVEIIIEPAEIS